MQDGAHTPIPMRPPRTFFDLQYRFAAAVAAVTGTQIENALLAYTSLYLRFGLARPLDAANPGWRAYLHGLRNTDDPLVWTWRCAEACSRPDTGEHFGCFSYHRPDPATIHPHFANRDRSGDGPLSSTRLPHRREELYAMFRAIAERHPDATTVRGGAWLYNLPAYASLFPPAYLRTARPVARFQAADRWGQFLDRHGQVRGAMTADFLAAIGRQRTLAGLVACFPYPVLAPECSIDHFYGFHER